MARPSRTSASRVPLKQAAQQSEPNKHALELPCRERAEPGPRRPKPSRPKQAESRLPGRTAAVFRPSTQNEQTADEPTFLISGPCLPIARRFLRNGDRKLPGRFFGLLRADREFRGSPIESPFSSIPRPSPAAGRSAPPTKTYRFEAASTLPARRLGPDDFGPRLPERKLPVGGDARPDGVHYRRRKIAKIDLCRSSRPFTTSNSHGQGPPAQRWQPSRTTTQSRLQP